VRLSLQRPEYDQAILAFKEKRPIEVTGDLVKEGKSWVLREPRNFVVHTVDDIEVAPPDRELGNEEF
jgi:hypothetical protein